MMKLGDEIKTKMEEYDLVLVYPDNFLSRLIIMLVRTVFPFLEYNPLSPLFGYDGKLYGLDKDKNLTEILVQRDYKNVYVINQKVKYSPKRISDFISIMKKYEEGKVFMRYVVVGASGILVNLLFFSIFYRLLGVEDIISLLIAIEISIIITFLLNNYWVFFNREYTKPMHRRIFGYHVTMLLGITINMVTYEFLIRLNFQYLVADFIGILFSSIWNFYLTNAHVFFSEQYNIKK